MINIRDYNQLDQNLILEISDENSGIINPDNFLNNLYKFIVVEVDNKIIGYICYVILVDRIEIFDFIIKKDLQNRKIGTKLLSYLIDKYEAKDIIDITLEVKVTNKIAISLYNKLGFKVIKTIPNYYQNDDGLLMKRDY